MFVTSFDFLIWCIGYFFLHVLSNIVCAYGIYNNGFLGCYFLMFFRRIFTCYSQTYNLGVVGLSSVRDEPISTGFLPRPLSTSSLVRFPKRLQSFTRVKFRVGRQSSLRLSLCLDSMLRAVIS